LAGSEESEAMDYRAKLRSSAKLLMELGSITLCITPSSEMWVYQIGLSSCSSQQELRPKSQQSSMMLGCTLNQENKQDGRMPLKKSSMTCTSNKKFGARWQSKTSKFR
jgi:hypothetical protein